ncbi:MAG: hypothetical protein IIY78_05990 [Clostridia bacterium]|nr:hypothetical protein [Clostridia bacterium]
MNKYEKPLMEVLMLDGEDIITASDSDTTNGPDTDIYQSPNETEIITPNP